MASFVLIIHGGAGSIVRGKMSVQRECEYKEALAEALLRGYNILSSGGSSVDAVEQVVMAMEDCPLFNAGRGSVYTSDGRQEMDAAIMDGSTLKAGSVAGLHLVKNPITAARKVMEHSRHVMLSSEGAELFAGEHGIEMVPASYFYNDARLKQLEAVKNAGAVQGDNINPFSLEFSDDKFGTVGAVALDQHGNLAAATSTGGMTNKKYGRIGDSPIIGAGTYASNKTCAISCTGHGEYFIRAVAAYDIAAQMQYGKVSLDTACNEVVMKKLRDAGGQGGVIGVDAAGKIALVFNTSGMYRGFVREDGKINTAIYQD